MADMETMESAPPPTSETIQIGPDKVTVGEEVIIEARHPFPDWQIREFRRNPILFQERKYYLRRKEAATQPYAIRYVLAPWDDSCSGGSGCEYAYDAEAVADRDHAVKNEHYEMVIRACLLLFYPLLGLLWSKTKDRLTRFCFVPRTITGVSVMFVFGLALLDGIFAKMLMVGSMRSGQLALGGIVRVFYGHDYINLFFCNLSVFWLDVVLFVLMVCDCVIRYGQHMGETQEPWGFLEWMKCFLPRKHRGSTEP